MKKKQIIPRDISWLSFNARVLQEAKDGTVPLKDRVRFLAIHSNNLEEFFRVRVPTLKAQIKADIENKNDKAEAYTRAVLNEIYTIVNNQQIEFAKIFDNLLEKLKKYKIFFCDKNNLTTKQKNYVRNYYETIVSPHIIPLFLETSAPPIASLWGRNMFLGVVMHPKNKSQPDKYAIIEVPTMAVGRFITLPGNPGEQNIILLEDVIRYNLPGILSSFGYRSFESYLFKVTQDAEIDMDSDLAESYVQSIEHGLKKRRYSQPSYFLYDKEMNENLLGYLTQHLNLSTDVSFIPRGKIRNFRDFMNLPVKLPESYAHQKPIIHPELLHKVKISEIILKKDVLICTPYHSFNSIIDMLREAAMDPNVSSIKITAYRLAEQSMICNALINAVRNGKKVYLVIELKATYDEEANLRWKKLLEEEGVKVSVGIPNLKIHAKICLIKKIIDSKVIRYGFVATGNLNEDTAKIYVDYFLLTSNPDVINDLKLIFKALTNSKPNLNLLKDCRTLLVSPVNLRENLVKMIDREIKNKRDGKRNGITIDINGLSDEMLIEKIYEAAEAGVNIRMIIRSIMCVIPEQVVFKKQITATSIVDKFLEHTRAWMFENDGAKDLYISSADWMQRNLNYRIEVTVPIHDPVIKKQILDILAIKLNDNVKARILDNNQSNHYVSNQKKKIRSQMEIYAYLAKLAHAKSRKQEKEIEDALSSY